MSRAARAAVLCSLFWLLSLPLRTHAQPAPAPSESNASPEIVVDLPAASESDRRRVNAAARETIERLTDWIGPTPHKSIRIAGKPWRGGASVDPAGITLDIPWRSAPETMDLESQTAFGLARLWWPGLSADDDTVAMANGLAWYLQGRIVDRLFDFAFLLPAHSAMGERYFGAAWPWTFRILPLGRWSGGLGREEYLQSRADRSRSHVPARRLPLALNASGLRGAHAFATLEQFVGWPTLQGALRVALGAANERRITRPEFEQSVASGMGRDLGWFFRVAFDESVGFDYAVQELTTGEASPCGSGPCYRTRVVVARLGSGRFTGSSADPTSSFESGDAMELYVVFADRQHASVRWDGRPASRTFEFDSVTPAVSAEVDPDRIVRLDENFLNNAIRREARSNVAVAKWVAYWMVWLEGTVLTYGALL